MAKKIDSIELGDYTTKDRVEVDIKLDVDNGEFEAKLNDQTHKHSSLQSLKEILKDEHRKAHSVVNWEKVIKVIPTKSLIEICYAAVIGTAIFTNEIDDRNGKERTWLHLGFGVDHELSLPRFKAGDFNNGDTYLFPYDEKTLETLNKSLGELKVIVDQHRVRLDAFKVEVAAMVEVK